MSEWHGCASIREPQENEMILPNGTVVAVVDGERMRLFCNRGHEPHIELIELPKLHPAAAGAGSGGRHHSSTANPDSYRLREDDFAAAAAGYLNREALAGAFEHVLIIADPRTLGELRKHFHASLTAKLVGELGKDLAAQSVEAIKDAITGA
jgi:protein required for attachment to host cells